MFMKFTKMAATETEGGSFTWNIVKMNQGITEINWNSVIELETHRQLFTQLTWA